MEATQAAYAMVIWRRLRYVLHSSTAAWFVITCWSRTDCDFLDLLKFREYKNGSIFRGVDFGMAFFLGRTGAYTPAEPWIVEFRSPARKTPTPGRQTCSWHSQKHGGSFRPTGLCVLRSSFASRVCGEGGGEIGKKVYGVLIMLISHCSGLWFEGLAGHAWRPWLVSLAEAAMLRQA